MFVCLVSNKVLFWMKNRETKVLMAYKQNNKLGYDDDGVVAIV